MRYRFPSGATLGHVNLQAKRLARANKWSVPRALEEVARQHGLNSHAADWGAVPQALRDILQPFASIVLPVGQGDLVSLPLSVSRPVGAIYAPPGAGQDHLILQVMRLSLALGVREVVWMRGGANAIVDTEWKRLESEFPGRVRRYQTRLPFEALNLRPGSVIVSGYGDLPVGQREELLPAGSGLIRIHSHVESPAAAMRRPGAAFAMTPWPCQRGVITRYLLTVLDQAPHLVDFDLWQGWLDFAVNDCLLQVTPDLQRVQNKWAGQAALGLSAPPAPLVPKEYWDLFAKFSGEGDAPLRRIDSESISLQLRFVEIITSFPPSEFIPCRMAG
jgi:hypothetical protein